MTASTAWAALRTELDAWHAAGQCATLWWRDDDAGKPSEALDRLLGLAETHEVPIAIAAVPTWLTRDSVERIHGCPDAAILQHGYAHQNHEPANNKKAEFGAARRQDEALAELCAGRMTLADRNAGALPVLTPPWNRIAGELLARLSSAGFTGISAYQARHAREPTPGLVQINTHIDIIDWRGTRGFVGEAAALDLCVSHLGRRRRGEVDSDEPTGLLTHHADHDAASWRFIERYVRATRDHPAVAWPLIAEIFATDGVAEEKG
jgi:hypothetical protein